MPDDDAALTLAWRQFCDRLAAAGASASSSPFPLDDPEHSVNVRHVARQLVMAVQGELEFGDPTDPMFHRYEEPWVQWGGPNPDNVYTRAAIDPDRDLPRTGNVPACEPRCSRSSTATCISAVTACSANARCADLDGRPRRRTSSCGSRPNRTTATGSRRIPTRAHAARPSIPLRLGARPRRDAHDRAGRHARACRRAAPTAAQLADALERAAMWIERSIEYWCAYVERARDDASPQRRRSARTRRRAARRPSRTARGWWELGPDDALLITTDVPRRRLLGLDRAPPLPARLRRLREPANQPEHGADASSTTTAAFGIVVAASDPGVPNWIDTEGQPEGMLVYRSIGTRTRPVPEARVVPLAAVRVQVPASHPVVDEHAAPRTTRAPAGRRARALRLTMALDPETAPAMGRPS